MGYNEQVQELLESYHDKIEEEIMTQLTKEFSILYNSVSELYGKLLQKGLIKEDPYFKESEIVELTIPSKEHYIEADAHWKVAERLTHYVSILSFISHNYNFSLNTFNFNELEKVKQFLDYYDWKNILSPNNSELNTKGLAKFVIEYKNTASDPLVQQTFEKCLTSINKSIDAILHKFKFILLYLKESYKLFIRQDILPIIQNKYPNSSAGKVLEHISKEIKENYSYLKFYKKFISEVINEEYSSDGTYLKEAVIKKLTITKKVEAPEKKVKKTDYSKDLIKLLLELGKVRNHFATVMDKLLYNHLKLKENIGNPISRLFNKIGSFLFSIKPKTIYTFNTTTKSGSSKEMSIHFEKLYDEIKKLEFELLDFSEEDKTQFFVSNHKDEINKLIDRQLMTIKKKINTLSALDNFLKSELKLKNVKAKGIKPELTVIKTIINSTTAMYSEYIDNTEHKK